MARSGMYYRSEQTPLFGVLFEREMANDKESCNSFHANANLFSILTHLAPVAFPLLSPVACRRLYWSMHSRLLTQKSRNSRALRDQLRWARMHVPETNCSYRTRVLVDCRATLEPLGSNRHKVKIVRLGQADVQSFGVNCRPPRERRDDARR